ncbi:MAG: ribonuclease HII [Eggerthellaceae bacterium]
MNQTVDDIKQRLKQADAKEFEVLSRTLADDPRKGVQAALRQAQERLRAQADEEQRIAALYQYESDLASGGVIVGLDEVGRGPLAGPLTIGAVVLPRSPQIQGLNDSKKLTPATRSELAPLIKETALAYAIVHIPPADIDELGMSKCLRLAFSRAVAQIEAQGVKPDVVLLDGNPLHFDEREVNVVKGDSKCASISAASIIAKVERDSLMDDYALEYPGYGFESSKGYGSAAHIAAIKEKGLTPIHRVSFCGNFLQESLF